MFCWEASKTEETAFHQGLYCQKKNKEEEEEEEKKNEEEEKKKKKTSKTFRSKALNFAQCTV